MLDRLKELGVSYELVDTAQMDKGELHELYISEAVPPSVKRKYRIGHIFGTQRISGVYFGREQPGLLVYQKGAEKPTDIFPHIRDEEHRSQIFWRRLFVSDKDTKEGFEKVE